MRFFAVALFFFGAASYGQTPEVPHKMRFAGMTLSIRDDARREIQKDVDALTKYPRYFGVKAERAKTYFPIIEKIFAEERLPDDFKYLALQESALISDAISVSDAVGFWQFKDFTAMEMGMRVDSEVDERMNLISATRAAARYLKQSNYMFNNWLFALQSYQMGAGGVQRSVGDQDIGAKHMEITSETYWYVKKYLAHKVAFENAVSGNAQVKVVPYEITEGKTLRDIAGEMAIDETKLLEFNKWAKTGKIPSDKTYTVLIPAGEFDDFNKLNLSVAAAGKSKLKSESSNALMETKSKGQSETSFINEVPVIKAIAGESVAALADRAGTDLSSFLKYNDISIDHMVKADWYFMDKKRSKSVDEFYVTNSTEDLWSISQHTGVQLKKIKKYNEVEDGQKVDVGVSVWLNGPKPKSENMPSTDVVAALGEEEFEWDDISGSKPSKILIKNQDLTGSIAPGSPQQSLVREKDGHIVKPGETFYSIARSENIEVVNLLAWNNMTISDTLKPGQLIKISANNTAAEPHREEITTEPARMEQFHEVQASDTLYSVARKYGVTIKEIMDWNQKSDLSLTVGEKLRIMQR